MDTVNHIFLVAMHVQEYEKLITLISGIKLNKFVFKKFDQQSYDSHLAFPYLEQEF